MDTVRQWMTSPAIVIPETLRLPEARQIMRERRIRRLPVVNANNQLVGIVSDGDIARVSDSPTTDVRDVDLYHTAATLPIYALMTRRVVAASPDTPISLLAQLLLEYRISGVPVIEGGRVVGVISKTDLCRILARQPEVTIAAARLSLQPTLQEPPPGD